jgi:hypothetical protein
MTGSYEQYLLHEDALRDAAATETSSDVFAVGGMLADLGLIETPAAAVPVPCQAFGRWLELSRRARSLSLPDIANQTGTDLLELVQIEWGEATRIQPRTIHQLAGLFAVDARKLAVVAGLIQDQPGGPITGAALRFAAQSESIAQLSPSERSALNEFVRLLSSPEKSV